MIDTLNSVTGSNCEAGKCGWRPEVESDRESRRVKNNPQGAQLSVKLNQIKSVHRLHRSGLIQLNVQNRVSPWL